MMFITSAIIAEVFRDVDLTDSFGDVFFFFFSPE